MPAPPRGRLGVQLAQALAEHGGAVGRARAVVVDRGALAAQDLRGGLRRGERPRPALERRLGRQGTDRHRRDPAEPDAGPRHDAVLDVQGEPDGHAGDVVEAPLGDLVERRQPGQGQRDAHRLDQLVGAAHALPVAGEVVGQGDLALAVDAGQHQARLQGEQRGRRVADRRAGAEVAAERGAVADQPRGELREQLGQQRHAAVETALDLGQRQRRADLDPVGVDDQAAQLGKAVDRDDRRGPRAAEIDLDTPVGRAGDEDGVRIGVQQAHRVGERRRDGRTSDPRGAAGSRRARGAARSAARRRSRQEVGRRGHRPRHGSGGSRCSGTGSRSARAGRTRWDRARGRAPHRSRRRGDDPAGSTRRPCCR